MARRVSEHREVRIRDTSGMMYQNSFFIIMSANDPKGEHMDGRI